MDVGGGEHHVVLEDEDLFEADVEEESDLEDEEGDDGHGEAGEGGHSA